MSTLALPFKAYSFGDLSNENQWGHHNLQPVPHAVIGKRCYGTFPANQLPDAGEPEGSVWKQHLGQVTYFTPGLDINPAWVCAYIKFETNFIPQKVKVILNNSSGLEPLTLQDWTTVSFINGQFLPEINTCQLTVLHQNVSYWIEFLFERTVNKAPGFYGSDGVDGFLAKSWWSISQAPVDSEFRNATRTDLSTVASTNPSFV